MVKATVWLVELDERDMTLISLSSKPASFSMDLVDVWVVSNALAPLCMSIGYIRLLVFVAIYVPGFRVQGSPSPLYPSPLPTIIS